MEFKDVLFSVENGIAVLTLNRPDTRNAITGDDVIEDFEKACSLVNSEKGIKVLVITGKDPAFSSGGNVKDMAAGKGMFGGSPMELVDNYRNVVQRIPRLLTRVEVPTIAAVNGPAIGAGCDLTLMCDIRVASKKAKFGETFLAVGLIPGDGGAWFLPRAVGLSRACEMTFTADVIDADTALEYGLVNHVAEHDDLMEKSLEIAGKIASKPGQALRMAKRLIYGGMDSSLEDVLDKSAAFQALCHGTEDHKEAAAAFLEKRKPVFKEK